MEYYPWPSLQEIVFELRFDHFQVILLFESFLSELFTKFFLPSRGHLETDWLQRAYFERLRERTEIMGQSRLLSLVSRADTVRINNIPYVGLGPCILAISHNASLLARLTPEFSTLLHGDLELNHILVQVTSSVCQPRFVVLDPRAHLKRGDFAYDLGKLMQTIHSKVDLLWDGHFVLQGVADHGDEAVIEEFHMLDHPSIQVLDNLQTRFPSVVSQCLVGCNDPKWELRARFAEAVHLCCAAPYFLHSDPTERVPLALLLTGLVQINEFV
jgi:hypothetical protein